MQVTLVVIFIGSIALAEMVTIHRHGGMSGRPGDWHFDPVTLHLPEGWQCIKQNHGTVLFVMQEAEDAEHEGRRLTCYRNQADRDMPPKQFLRANNLVDRSDRLGEAAVLLSISGQPTAVFAVERGDDPEDREVRLLACCARPTGFVITFVLECPNTVDPNGDLHAFLEILKTVQIKD